MCLKVAEFYEKLSISMKFTTKLLVSSKTYFGFVTKSNMDQKCRKSYFRFKEGAIMNLITLLW